jgi:hypothetical protein
MSEALIKQLRDQLATYTGAGYKGDPNCCTMTVFAGDAEVLIEYEFTMGEEAKTNGPPERCYEGTSDEVAICGALINGEWVDPEDVFAPALIEKWEQAIIDSEYEAVEDQRSARQDYED